jgi:molybdopterin synthase sulfur carrier subunit
VTFHATSPTDQRIGWGLQKAFTVSVAVESLTTQSERAGASEDEAAPVLRPEPLITSRESDGTKTADRQGLDMRWKLFADLAEVAGRKEIEVETEPDDTVGEALSALVAQHPELEDRIYEAGELRDHINVLRNGTNVHTENGLDTELEDGDELALFPPVSGG